MTLKIGYLAEQSCRFCGHVVRERRVRFVCPGCGKENMYHSGTHGSTETLRDLERSHRRLRVVTDEEAQRAAERPKTRSDCKDGPRPCPWVSCKYHLALEVTRFGGLKHRFPGTELEDMPQTCLLDVTDEGPKGLDVVGYLMNIGKERVRQIEEQAKESFKEALILTEEDV
jgi:hypothetical protein